MPRDCPDCGRVLREKATSCQCGWGVVVSDTKLLPRDHDWWRCFDVDTAGNRCSKPGSLSDSTFGKGPWYCRDHYPSFRGQTKNKTAPPGGFVTLQRALGRAPMREPGEEG